MTTATFAEIVNRTKGHTDYLSLHVLGEPLLHPELGPILDLCHQHNLQVNLTTNGALLPQCREMLINSPALRQINISLHCITEQGKDADPNKYLDNVLDFAQRFTTETKANVSLRLWNEPLLSSATTQPCDNPIHAALETFFALPYRLRDINTGRGISLAPRIYLSCSERFIWPSRQNPALGNRGTCRGLKDHLAILVDGSVIPCCLDGEGEITLGNILNDGLADILAAPRAMAMKQSAAKQMFNEPLCLGCSYRQRFQVHR